MLHGKRIVVVMPAYNAGRTLEATWRDLPHDIVDEVVVVDDASDDDTVAMARALGLDVILHPQNMGYGANQKTCYKEAIARAADIVVMVHPDYQYDPRLVTAMAGMVARGSMTWCWARGSWAAARCAAACRSGSILPTGC